MVPPPEAQGGHRPWLVIGIPTVGRSDGLDYLNPTLDYIMEQLPDPVKNPSSLLVGRVKVLVLNNAHGKAHPAFEKAQKRLDARVHPKGSSFAFVTNKSPLTHGTGREPGSANQPGSRVRQQTVDMAAVIDESWKRFHPSMFFLMEDDFRLCPHFFQVLDYAVEKMALVDEDWLVLRISYGLAGAILHGRDMETLSAYLKKHVTRRPPDHLLVEWFAGETSESAAYKGERKHFAMRHNLLQHFGTTSSIRRAKQGRYAGCYERLDLSLFEVEAFKNAECPDEDVWPCPSSAWTEAHPSLGLHALEEKVYRVDHGGGLVAGLRKTDRVKSFAAQSVA